MFMQVCGCYNFCKIKTINSVCELELNKNTSK